MSLHSTGSPTRFGDITPDDNTELPKTLRAIHAGSDGNIEMEDRFGNQVTIPVLASQVIICSPAKILTSATTATGLVGYYE